MFVTWIVAASAVVGCAVWAFAPMHETAAPELLKATPNPIQQVTPDIDQPIDVGVFAANLWNPPPVPSSPSDEAVAKAPPQKPLNLQLIGIIDEGSGVRRAALYDIDNDRLLIVSAGDSVHEQTVTSITDQSIELTDGRTTRRLVLQEPT